jgi:hypothetical protein
MSDTQSWESTELDAHPEVRAQVHEAQTFHAWKSTLPKIEVDGETLYLPWGDIPMTEDQLVYQWARLAGWLPGEASSADGSSEDQ